ncbi:MAG: DUF1697 domain-containing protein [Patescibacteria group bacterium]|nr:DUF1697 domain-containing protein [Patescibacteria group bacterium]
MRYVALLRGINVGKTKRIEMKRLKALFETLGYFDVSTYINSGNIVFEAKKAQKTVRSEVENALKKEFGILIPTLVKTDKEMRKIADAIPAAWKNDDKQRTDVAYLFDKADNKKTIDELPVKHDYIDILYVKGALIWNVKRLNYNKSHLNKLIAHPLYQSMTVRNVNTARWFAAR